MFALSKKLESRDLAKFLVEMSPDEGRDFFESIDLVKDVVEEKLTHGAEEIEKLAGRVEKKISRIQKGKTVGRTFPVSLGKCNSTDI
jgi:hypothetical protein